MSKSETNSALAQEIRDAALSGFEPKFGQLGQAFAGNDRWAALIPKLANWREALAEKAIGLGALINLAGLNAFTADQEAMDNKVADVLAGR